MRTAESPARGIEMVFEPRRAYVNVGPLSPIGELQQQDFVSARDAQEVVKRLGELVDVAVRFETIRIKAVKSRVKVRALTPLWMAILADTLGQSPPTNPELKIGKRAFKAELAAEKQRQKDEEAASNAMAAQRARAEQAARQPRHEVTNSASFLHAMRTRVGDDGRVDRAIDMLRREVYRLHHRLSANELVGVVKSQSDPDLLYAVRLRSDGTFGCCTQNLHACGGLRGRACKHLLLVLLALVRSGDLDPTLADAWLARHIDAEPTIDRDAVNQIFLLYLTAGWSPLDTSPTDDWSLC
jgi:hypothetical protein